MEEKILESLIKRPGLSDKRDMLEELIRDSIIELKQLLNYVDNNSLPETCTIAIKDLVLYRLNLDGVQGIQSESQSSGGSTVYVDALPPSVKAAVRKYRRVRRISNVN